ncbi:site-specific integrase, partial [Streptococcus suis]|nr:site-specific integrase [Streptococcus suis]NQI09460.1 site-specific integrase [Streptococcus suis]
MKRKEAKETGDDIELVHTHRTLHNYSGSWHCFAKWVSIN